MPDKAGTITLAGHLADGKQIEIRIILRRTNATDRVEAQFQSEHNLGSDWWGVDTVPDHVVSILEVRVGKDYVPLPRSSYGDLADVRQASLMVSKEKFKISVYGGETGTGYAACLEFDGSNLIGREVSHNEMGLEEKTQYFPVRGN